MTEKELIYLYRTENHENLKSIFYEKNEKMLARFTKRLLGTRIFFMPINLSDFILYSSISLVECLKSFDLKQKNYQFSQALAMINKRKILNYARDLSGSSEQVLNNALSYDAFKGSSFCDNQLNIPTIDIEQDIELEKFNIFLNKYPKIVQNIISLKLSGHSNNEISKKLGIDQRKTNDIISLVITEYKKTKNNY